MRLVENAIVAGRFRLNHLLQRGGMGSVWHATHLGLDIPCALKFVKGELLENEDVVSRFEREAKAAAQLRSPNVVQILDHGVFDGTPYMAMELLDGEDLGERLRKIGRLTPESLHHIMTGVCRALYKAHSQGVVHRDLKPGNIFLVKDDDQEIPKVLDFGIAKSMTDVVGGGTKTGAMLGTPYYMSPEQAQGTKQVDFRSDLWSLAVICFQCLTGKLPFQSEALGDLLVKIIVQPIPVPSQMASVPPGFDQWWLKAASRDSAERFQSAKEFSDTLAIVCGISQISSVIDRSQLHIEALGGVPPGEPPLSAGATLARPLAPPMRPAAAPPPFPPASSRRPAAGMPAVAPPPPQGPPPPMMATPAPLGPPPVAAFDAPPVNAPAPGQATPTPLSRSTVEDATVPVAKGTPVLTYIAAGVALMTVCLMIGWYAFRLKSGANTADQATTSSKTAAASSAPTPAATPVAPSAAASAAPPPAATDTAPAPTATTAGGGTPSGWPSSADGTQAAPPSTASAAPAPEKDTTASNSGASNSGASPGASSGSSPGSSSGSSSGSHSHGSSGGKHGTTTKPPAPSSKQPVDMGF